MKLSLIPALAAPLALVALLCAAQEAKPAQDANAEKVAYQKASYPLAKCPISGEKLGPDAVDTVVDGRLVRVCCKDCVAAVEKKKDEVFKSIDAAVIEQQKKSYPLDTCPISGEKLAEAKSPVDYVHGTRLVRLCCANCVAELKKDPGAVMKKLDAAYIAKQKSDYPLDTCVVSGEKLGSDPKMEPVDFLYGTRYFRLCCANCKKAVAKDPEAMWAKVEAARAAKKGAK